MKIFLFISTLIYSIFSQAAELSITTKTEVSHLLSYLENSGCQFNRNGSWYTPDEAAAHIKKKYDYLLKKDMLTTTESFIENAATKSSMSGQAYEVKCDGKTAILSSIWFTAELQKYRKSNSK